MSKRGKNIKSVSTGILSSLEAMENDQPEVTQEQQQAPPAVTEEEDPNKKFKRSYMITKKHIKRIRLLTAELDADDFSEIIRDAIDFYYDHKMRKDE